MKIEIQGVLINKENIEVICEKIKQFIKDKKSHLVVTANPEMVMVAKEDKHFKEILDNADIVTADGFGIVLAAKILGGEVPNRVTGIDLMQRLFEISEIEKYKFFFLGAKEGVASLAREKIMEMYPDIQIVGTQHGYFTDEEEIIKQIKKAKPDILLVAMGMGKQEKWIWQHKDILGCPVSIGVGGSFDVLSGNVQRAPKWMQKAGMEWLYRLIQEPSRYKRMVVLPKFLLRVIVQRFKGAGGAKWPT